MRLTLRTLLAYLDDTLKPGEAKEIGDKLSGSDSAKALVERIQLVLRRRRLVAPPADPNAATLNANDVAEYLDNQLNMKKLADLERILLESDTNLAEVAAVHQVLSMATGMPIEVSDQLRMNLYDLQSDQKQTNRSKSSTATKTKTMKPLPNSLPLSNSPVSQPFFDPVNQKSIWHRWSPAIMFVATLTLVFIIWQQFQDPQNSDPLDDKTQVASADKNESKTNANNPNNNDNSDQSSGSNKTENQSGDRSVGQKNETAPKFIDPEKMQNNDPAPALDTDIGNLFNSDNSSGTVPADSKNSNERKSNENETNNSERSNNTNESANMKSGDSNSEAPKIGSDTGPKIGPAKDQDSNNRSALEIQGHAIVLESNGLFKKTNNDVQPIAPADSIQLPCEFAVLPGGNGSVRIGEFRLDLKGDSYVSIAENPNRQTVIAIDHGVLNVQADTDQVKLFIQHNEKKPIPVVLMQKDTRVAVYQETEAKGLFHNDQYFVRKLHFYLMNGSWDIAGIQNRSANSSYILLDPNPADRNLDYTTLDVPKGTTPLWINGHINSTSSSSLKLVNEFKDSKQIELGLRLKWREQDPETTRASIDALSSLHSIYHLIEGCKLEDRFNICNQSFRNMRMLYHTSEKNRQKIQLDLKNHLGENPANILTNFLEGYSSQEISNRAQIQSWIDLQNPDISNEESVIRNAAEICLLEFSGRTYDTLPKKKSSKESYWQKWLDSMSDEELAIRARIFTDSWK